jgi:hypothetical protein
VLEEVSDPPAVLEVSDPVVAMHHQLVALVIVVGARIADSQKS